MNYNFDENDIIQEIYNSYLDKNNWQLELKEVLLEIVIYNDDENINEIIDLYGGSYHLCNLYNYKYKNLININDTNISYYSLLAFIGLYNSIYDKILEKIVMDFSLNI